MRNTNNKTKKGFSHAWAFTRYSFTLSRLCMHQSSFHSSIPLALPTLSQYYCTTIGQYKTPTSISRVYAIHHTMLAITMSCKGQVSLYKILFHFKPLLSESIILLLLPPACKSYPIAVPLHDHCSIYAPPTDPPVVCHTPYNIGDGNIV